MVFGCTLAEEALCPVETGREAQTTHTLVNKDECCCSSSRLIECFRTQLGNRWHAVYSCMYVALEDTASVTKGISHFPLPLPLTVQREDLHHLPCLNFCLLFFRPSSSCAGGITCNFNLCFLDPNKVEHFLASLLPIWTFSLMKCLFVTIAIFSVVLSFLIDLKKLYILDTNSFHVP